MFYDYYNCRLQCTGNNKTVNANSFYNFIPRFMMHTVRSFVRSIIRIFEIKTPRELQIPIIIVYIV